MSKKVTKEAVKEQNSEVSPHESEQSEESKDDSLIPCDAIINFLLYIINRLKFKKNPEDWVRYLIELVKKEEEMREVRVADI